MFLATQIRVPIKQGSLVIIGWLASETFKEESGLLRRCRTDDIVHPNNSLLNHNKRNLHEFKFFEFFFEIYIYVYKLIDFHVN